MNNVSVCITSYYADYYLIYDLLKEFSKQTEAPSEIIFYSSGINYIHDIPDNLIVSNSLVPIYKIFNKQKTIQSIARNICSKIASSDIVIFFDVDDIPHFQKIEITKHVFITYKPDFLLHNYSQNLSQEYINKNLVEIRNDLTIDENSTNLYCGGLSIHHAHIAVRKNVFRKVRFNESLQTYRREDGIFCQDLVRNNFKGVYTPEKLVQYN